MNKSNGTLIVVGLISLIVGGAITHFLLGPKPQATCPPVDVNDHAKYVVFFGDCEINPNPNGRVRLASPLLFKAALATLRTRINTLTEVATPGGPAVSIGPAPITVTDTPVAYISVTQRGPSGQPCAQHVTQKVGLDNAADVQKLLALLNPGP